MQQAGKGVRENQMLVMGQKCKLALPYHVQVEVFQCPCQSTQWRWILFKGPWWLSVPIPSSQRQGMGEEDLKHLSEKLSIAFRPIYCPPIFSISSTPILGFHYTPRYNGLMRKWKLRILNCLEKYTRKQGFFFSLTFLFAVSLTLLSRGFCR